LKGFGQKRRIPAWSEMLRRRRRGVLAAIQLRKRG